MAPLPMLSLHEEVIAADSDAMLPSRSIGRKPHICHRALHDKIWPQIGAAAEKAQSHANHFNQILADKISLAPLQFPNFVPVFTKTMEFEIHHWRAVGKHLGREFRWPQSGREEDHRCTETESTARPGARADRARPGQEAYPRFRSLRPDAPPPAPMCQISQGVRISNRGSEIQRNSGLNKVLDARVQSI